jgi:hypothetical protein
MPGYEVGLERVRIGIGERPADDLLYMPIMQVNAWSERAASAPGRHGGEYMRDAVSWLRSTTKWPQLSVAPRDLRSNLHCLDQLSYSVSV